MKSIFIILLLLVNLTCFSQSNVAERDPLYLKDYESELKQENSSIIISRYKSSSIDEISLVLKTEAHKCPDANGVYLTFSNGEVLSFDSLEVNCSSSEARKFNLSGSIILTPSLYKKLSQSEITEFRLGNQNVPVVYKEKGENLKGLFKFSESF